MGKAFARLALVGPAGAGSPHPAGFQRLFGAPGVIGRRIEVCADVDRVWVLCDGKTVADHERIWAWHQTVSDSEHVAAAKLLHRKRIVVFRPTSEPEV
jgi:hypothetical protein